MFDSTLTTATDSVWFSKTGGGGNGGTFLSSVRSIGTRPNDFSSVTHNTIVIRTAVFDDLTFDGDEQAACQYEKFIVGRRLWVKRVLPLIESELANQALSPADFKDQLLALTFKLEDSEKTGFSRVSAKCDNPDSSVNISTQTQKLELLRELDVD